MPRPRTLRAAFYTRDDVARALSRWILARSPRRVLEPSCGPGAFIAALTSEISAAASPVAITAVDIDSGALSQAREHTASPKIALNLIEHDFLAISPRRLGLGKFDACIGNPPYIRHHRLSATTVELAQRRARDAGITLPAASNYYAYFVAHALGFLDQGASVALLLPSFGLNTHYMNTLLAGLSARFASVQLVHVGESPFIGTEERSVVLLATGFGAGPCTLDHVVVDSRDGLCSLLDKSVNGDSGTFKPRHALNGHVGTLTDSRRRLGTNLPVHRLGDLLTIRIGIVTGASTVFVHSMTAAVVADAGRLGSSPVIADGKCLTGARWTDADHAALDASGRRSRLLTLGTKKPHAKSLLALIRAAEKEGVHLRPKCADREPWYAIAPPAPPSVFIKSVSMNGPTIAANLSRAQCTNTLHAAWVKSTSASLDCVVASSWTTPYLLDAELRGRRLGRCALRVDMQTLAALPVFVAPGASAAVDGIDLASRSRDFQQARQIADEWLSASLDDQGRAAVQAMQKTLRALHILRGVSSSHNEP